MSKGDVTADVSTLEPEKQWAHLPVHPFVSLLVSRMESHPREFFQYVVPEDGLKRGMHIPTNPKWTEYSQMIERCRGTWNRKEKWLYNNALRAVRLQETHEILMSKLLT